MKKIVYIDMDDVLCDFTGAYTKAREINPKMQFPQAEFGFFTNLKPIKDGVEAVKMMIDSPLYDPYILTAPSIKNPLSYTEKRIWIEQKFGIKFVNKLIISPNKCLLKGDYLIDDNVSGKGQESFEGKLIHFGQSTFPDWKTIIKFLDINS